MSATRPSPDRDTGQPPARSTSVTHGVRMLLADRRTFVALALADLALKAVLLIWVRHASITGDEAWYDGGAATLAENLRQAFLGRPMDASTLGQSLIGYGWFMPGMSFVLAPLYLAVVGAGTVAVRIWCGLLTSVVLVVFSVLTRRVVGPATGTLVLIVPGLLPMWALFSMTAWGDVLGGLVGAILVLLWLRAVRMLRAGMLPGLLNAAGFGLGAIVAVYLRSSSVVLAVGLMVLYAVALLIWGRSWRHAATRIVVLGAVFCALLAPWSVAASDYFHAPVVTTTDLPMNLAYAFGPERDRCYGPCGQASPPYLMWDRAVARADRMHTTVLVAQRQLAGQVLHGVTPRSYARDVGGDAGRYFLSPNQFMSRFETTPPTTADHVVEAISWVMYGSALLVIAIALLTVSAGSTTDRVLGIVLKLAVAAVATQVFVHVSSGRYWPSFVPLAPLATAVVVRSSPFSVGRARRHPERDWLAKADLGATLTWSGVVLCLLVLAV